MKKSFYLAAAFSAFMFASCGDTKSTANTPEGDSIQTNTDEVIASDLTKQEKAAAATQSEAESTNTDPKINYLWTFYDNYINEKQPVELLRKKNLLTAARNAYSTAADYDILTQAQDEREGDIHSYMSIKHEKDNWYRITFDDGEYGKSVVLIEVIEQDGYKISDIRVIE